MIDWNIQSRSHACQACGKPFVDQQVYRTVLVEEKLGYVRQDVCSSCWESQFSEGANCRKGFISHWQGVFEVPTIQPDPIRKDTAESLLRKLIEQNDPRHSAACFILAAMLERKRILKVKAQSLREQVRFSIYEHSKTGDVFTIADPNLQLNQLDEVQRDVAHLLEHGLDESPGEPASAAPPTTTIAELNKSTATPPAAESTLEPTSTPVV